MHNNLSISNLKYMSVTYIGLFKKRRGLQKTRTPRINALKHCRRLPFSSPEPLSLICNRRDRRDQETTGSGEENGRPPFDESFNDSCSCSLFTPAAMAGNRPSVRESRKFCQNFISPIAGTSLSNHSVDRWWTFCRGFRTSFATAQH